MLLRSIPLILAVCCWLVFGDAKGFDMERFLALDRSEIRAAERQLDRLLEKHEQDSTAASLTEAERYVVERELYWRAASGKAPQTFTLEDGSRVIKPHSGTMNTTVLGTDERGNPVLGCGPMRSFQHGREQIKASRRGSGVVR